MDEIENDINAEILENCKNLSHTRRTKIMNAEEFSNQELKNKVISGAKKSTKSTKTLSKLDLLKMSENQDVEAIYPQDLESNQSFRNKYFDYYDDVKQSSKFIKEDW